jgi:CheY-like chemotaxis protein
MSLIKNIFLVDDDATFVFMTKKIIRSTAIDSEINEFPDGEAAIDFLKDHLDHTEPLPDVIFLDLNMPIMDGWGFLEEYVSLEPKMKKKVKLYIVSSSISPHEIERAKQFSSVSDFIIKPLVKEKFIEIIESLE